MKLVNAEIKSKKELATRLMDGEVFWSHLGNKVYYKEESERSPFRVNNDHCNDLWDKYESLQKEVLWYKNIEKPVLCYVSDSSETYKSSVSLIEGYDENRTHPYTTRDRVNWKYATPVSQEEVNQWVLG